MTSFVTGNMPLAAYTEARLSATLERELEEELLRRPETATDLRACLVLDDTSQLLGERAGLSWRGPTGVPSVPCYTDIFQLWWITWR